MNDYLVYRVKYSNELYHYGVKGQKWGIRRYQNEDGSLTEEGKKRYNSVFVSGSSKTTDPNSEYYRKELPNEVINKLDDYIKKNNNIIVGDAPGIDTQVQEYLNNKNYKNVSVYTTSKQPRYLANKKWKIHIINTYGLDPNSKEGLRMKDIAMTNDAKKGFAVILENGGAGATRNNVQRLIDQNKNVKVFMLTANNGDQYVKNILEELNKGGNS